jgi:hypothetical protein
MPVLRIPNMCNIAHFCRIFNSLVHGLGESVPSDLFGNYLRAANEQRIISRSAPVHSQGNESLVASGSSISRWETWVSQSCLMKLTPQIRGRRWMLPPEAIDPSEFGQLDHRIDIYHTGLLFLQLAYGDDLWFTAEEIKSGKPREMALVLPSPTTSP